MKKLLEPESGVFTVQYLPNNTEVTENPPRFSWLPSNEKNGKYDLEIALDSNFEKIVYKYTDIMYNFFAPNHTLKPDKYFWRYTLSGGEHSYSTTREFVLNEGVIETPMPCAKERFTNSDLSHPRLWIGGQRLEEFKKAVKSDPTHCSFDEFIKKKVEKDFKTPFYKEPPPYPPELKVLRPLPPKYRIQWRKAYHDCQELNSRVRATAIAGVVTENQEWIDEAVELVLHLASFDCNGTTKRSYNDESAFRVLSGLCWGYDWLYNHMTDEQREKVKKSLIIRTKEVVDHVFYDSKIQYSLYDSHAIRSVSFCLIPCGIALFNEYEEAESWINCAVDYVNVLYTPWGGKKGGWAEGGAYWTTGVGVIIDGLNILKNFTGVDIFKRPFFKNTGDFPLYCFPQDTFRASFGDQSNIGLKPQLRTGLNMRSIACVSEKPEHMWYYDKVIERTDLSGDVPGNGWFEYYTDKVMFLENADNIQSKPPESGRIIKYFSDVGWVAMHIDMDKDEDHLFFLTKSSKYGSVSHSHGDQNAIMLFAYGDPLLVESGYYIAFGSDMHVKWRRQTRSKNCILIDGRGQYYEDDKVKQLSASGEIQEFEETDKYVYVKENATNAYLENVPELEDFTREIYFVDNSYFVVIDNVKISKELDISFLLHSIYKPEYKDNKYAIRGEKANLDMEMIYISSGIADLHLTDEFPDDIDPSNYEGKEMQWHYTLKTNKARQHTLVSYYYPSKADSVYDFTASYFDDKKTCKFINYGKEFEIKL